MKRTRSLALGLCIILPVGWCGLALGQSAAGGPVATTTSTAPAVPTTQTTEAARTEAIIQLLQERLRQVQDDKKLDEDTRSKAAELYGQAVKELQSIEIWSRRAAEYDKAIREAPRQLQTLQEELQKAIEPQLPGDLSDTSVAELQVKADEARRTLLAAKQALTEANARNERRLARRLEIVQRQEEIARELSEPQEPEGPPAVVLAHKSLQRARSAARAREQAAYEKELARNEATAELLTAQRDALNRRIGHNEKLVEALQEAVNKRRLQDAVKRARDAEEEARAKGGSFEVVREMADFNLNLAKRRQGLSVKIAEAGRRCSELQKLLDTTRESSAEVRVKVGAAGVSRTMGMMLRKERAGLPKMGLLRQELRAFQENSAEAEVDQIDLRRQYDRLVADPDAAVAADLSRLDARQPSPDERDEVEKTLREGYETRREYLESLIKDYETYSGKLIELQGVTEALLNEAEAYRVFIDERILWLRSHDELRLGRSLADAWEALCWLSRTARRGELLQAIKLDFRSNPVTISVALLGCAVIIGARRRFRARLERDGDRASQKLNTSFAPTAAALLWTALMTISWPLVFWVLAWRCDAVVASAQASELAKAIAAGLARVGFMLAMVMAIRELCRPKGLAESHLGWPRASLLLVRRQLLWFLVVSLPLGFVISVIEQWQTAVDWKDSLSRLAFLISLAAVTVVVAIVLRPSTGVFREHLARHQGRLLDRLRYCWYAGALAVPVIMAGLAFYGYYYTAQQLIRRTYASIWFVMAILVIRGLVIRWVFLTHRKLAIAQARKRLAEKHTEAARADGTAGDAKQEPLQQAEPEPEPEPELDFALLSAQARQLFGAALGVALVMGLWLIWVDILPALTYLRSITLYPKAGITLADLALAIITLVMIWVANRNVPGFLEIVVLSRLPLNSGERYAIITVCRYVIIAAGIMMTCGFLGISWPKVQWLLAAITVGLGFGLQEIFANFVSGLILLFERPVRVGDTVTIGDISGTISRIHIRATTVTTWDRKELIIPNKEFVTGQVVNWTLSDSVVRIVIPVGVAYGSDTAQVERILQRIVGQHPMVTRDPPPQVFFVGFGASSLDFEVRAFITDVDQLGSVRHGLLNAIDREFRQAGIEIPFPQQDVHVRSSESPPPAIEGPQPKQGHRP